MLKTQLGTTFLTALCAASLGALAAPTLAAETVPITIVAGHPPVALWVRMEQEVLIPTINAELAKTGNYEIAWTEAFSGTLAKVGEELEAVETGLADMAVSWSLFDAAKLPLQNVSLFAPFLDAPIECSTDVTEDLQTQIPEMGAQWEKYNQVYLGGGIYADTFQLWSKKPVETLEDLKGLKMAGPGPATNWINGTGAVGVSANLNLYYNDIKSGVYDAAAVHYTGAIPNRLYEVAPYVTEVHFANAYGGGITFNTSRWEKLPEEVRMAINTAVDAYQAAYLAETKVLLEKAHATAVENGATIITLPDDVRKAWADALPNAAMGWAQKLDEAGLPGSEVLAGYMDGMKACGAKPLRDWSQN